MKTLGFSLQQALELAQEALARGGGQIMIRLEQATKRYGSTLALNNITIHPYRKVK